MEKILSVKEIEKLVSLSRSTIKRKEERNEFPKRIVLGKCRVGWSQTEVLEWIEKQKNRRVCGGGNNA